MKRGFLKKWLHSFLICCLFLPLIGSAQEDTPQSKTDSNRTYKLVGIFNQQISEIAASSDYKIGMAKAISMSKPALIYFNAYGSINARKFDEEVLSKPEIMSLINTKYQLIVLFADDTTPLDKTKKVMSKALNRRLETMGDYNLNLQLHKFGSDRQPMFYIVNTKGKIVDSTLYSNPNKFQKFISKKDE